MVGIIMPGSDGSGPQPHFSSNNLRALYGLIAAAEGYLDEVERLSSGKGGAGKREAEEEGVEVAKELVKLSAEKMMNVYKGSKLMSIVERMLKEASENL